MSGAGEDRRLGPRSGKITAITVGTGALGLTAIVGAPANGGPGPGYYTFQAIGGDIGLTHGAASGLTEACGVPALSGTSMNCEVIPAGQTRDFWLDSVDTHLNAIASVAACTLAYRRSSP
jgi:hypothetical protein